MRSLVSVKRWKLEETDSYIQQPTQTSRIGPVSQHVAGSAAYVYYSLVY